MKGTRLSALIASLGVVALASWWAQVVWSDLTSQPLGDDRFWNALALIASSLVAIAPGLAIAIAPRSANRALWMMLGFGIVFATFEVWVEVDRFGWLYPVILFLASVGYLIAWLTMIIAHVRNTRPTART